MAWLCGFGQLRGPWGPRLISEISVSVRDSVWLQLSKRQWLKHRGQGKQPGAGRGALAFCLAVLSWASLHQDANLPALPPNMVPLRKKGEGAVREAQAAEFKEGFPGTHCQPPLTLHWTEVHPMATLSYRED